METIISICTLFGVLVGIVVNVSSIVGKRESKAAADARIEVKLDNIYSKVDDIQKRQSASEIALQQHEVRITKLEAKERKE
jgi:cell division protein FtsX